MLSTMALRADITDDLGRLESDLGELELAIQGEVWRRGFQDQVFALESKIALVDSEIARLRDWIKRNGAITNHSDTRNLMDLLEFGFTAWSVFQLTAEDVPKALERLQVIGDAEEKSFSFLLYKVRDALASERRILSGDIKNLISFIEKKFPSADIKELRQISQNLEKAA